VVKLSPATNYQLVTVLAQIHDDDWYSDNPTVLGGAGRQPGSQTLTPRPLIGLVRNDASGNLPYFDFEVQEDMHALSDGTATDTLTVSFAQPSKPNANSPNLPLVGLAAQYDNTQGTLAAGSNFYYAVTAVDAAGNEGALSFTVPALVPGTSPTNSITLEKLSFPSAATSANFYRGTTPQMLYRIASNVLISAIQANNNSYTDSGAEPQPMGPPDASFDHANFYYRYEYAGPFTATSFSSTSIGSDGMGATPLAYAGMVTRIIKGTGRGQERLIATNDQSTLTVTPAWSVLPDKTSEFVISQASWVFAAVSPTSPAQFEIPYQAGTVIQISGRGANVNNQEGTADLCPLTRWALGGGQAQAGVPATPEFSLSVPGGGDLTIFQVGFSDLTNTASVSTGTLQIYYWNELNAASSCALAAAIDSSSATLTLTGTPTPNPGDVIQIGAELISIVTFDSSTNQYTVNRAAFGSVAGAHDSGDVVLVLSTSFIIVPFATNFFENKASVNYVHTVSMPDIRICGAEFFVTNAFGNSRSSQQCYTSAPDAGLRTLSGGQFSIQVSGYLATQQNAAPPLLIETSHAVRDVRATVTQAATGYNVGIDILQDGAELCHLTIASGDTTSAILDGLALDLPFLNGGSALTANITLDVIQGFTGSISPGRDLTITLRL
jgi:hypothetical protein